MNAKKIFKEVIRTGVTTLAAIALVLNVGGYFTPVARATSDSADGLSIEKIVSNTKSPAWKEEVDAEPGDIVEFKITFKNICSPTPMTNVIVRDELPGGLTYYPGHFHIIANAGQVDNPGNVNDFFGTGIDVTEYPELGLGDGLPKYPEYIEILFKAKVDCPTTAGTVHVNRGYVKSDQAEEIGATANVRVTRVCQIGMDLEKIVSNTEAPEWKESVGAGYAERVEFKLTFKNTGETTLENVTVRDVLPDELTYYADGKIKIVSNSGTVESTDAGAFFGSGLNIGSLVPYDVAHGFEYIEVTFVATVNTCSTDGNITITNTGYVKADGVSELNDPATVGIAKCGTKPEPEEPEEGEPRGGEGGQVLGAADTLPATGPENLVATAMYLGYLGFLLRRLKLTRYF